MASVPGVQLGYLFGSRARGEARPDSDVDVAVVVDPAAREQHLREAREALARQLGPLGDAVDLLELDRAGGTIAFRVIRDGQCLLARDPAARIRLEAWIARRYDDEAPTRALFRSAAIRVGRALGEAAGDRR